MNAHRRKEIVRLLEAAQNLSSDIAGLADEEREYYDNMPEAFQSGEKGDQADAAATALEEAASAVDEIVNYLEEAAQ